MKQISYGVIVLCIVMAGRLSIPQEEQFGMLSMIACLLVGLALVVSYKLSGEHGGNAVVRRDAKKQMPKTAPVFPQMFHL